MHDSRHKLQAKVSSIKSDAIKVGALHGNRLIVTSIAAADEIHGEAIQQAQTILLDFIERRQSPPAEIVEWARPHLENMNNSLLGVVPPNNLPGDHKRLTQQYAVVFQQRLVGMLREVEIGFVRGTGFARAEKVESKEEWIKALEAVQLLKPTFNSEYLAQLAICKRAHNGLIRARARRFMTDDEVQDDCEVPKAFWWTEGQSAMSQNWELGDFDTWIERGEVHLRAFGVSFLRAQIEELIPVQTTVAAASQQPAPNGGRPPADWWEDCIIHVAFQYFRADIKPKTQADVERAMQEWITGRGYEIAPSTVRARARKLWQAIKTDAAEN